MKRSCRIRIMTRRAGYNPGSSLQAYALQYSIARLGYACKILNYDEYQLRWKIRPAVENSIYAIMRLCPWVFQKVWPTEYLRLKNRRVQRQKFDGFETEMLELTQKCYKNSRSIARDVQDGDVYICGSDQIWHPRLFDRAMFLDFVQGKKAGTIAYAPSLGLDKIEKYRDEIGRLIARIDHVTVREGKGVEQVEELTGRNVKAALDPTFLLDSTEWDAVKVDPPFDEPYVLCYFLGREQNPHRFISELKAKTGYAVKVIQMYYNVTTIDGDSLFAVDPREFLGLVKNAAYVCTDSFHCVVFSIIFRRTFFCFEKIKQGGANSNHRISYLLGLFGLGHRLVSPDASFEDGCQGDINYDQIHRVLDEMKQESIGFLRDSLEEECLRGRVDD